MVSAGSCADSAAPPTRGRAYSRSLMPNHVYDIYVTRDRHWYMVHIPELDGLTQACSRGEVEPMAREYISLAADVPFERVSVRVVAAPSDQRC